ncbi:DUF1376 domain-containing protein [Bartonella schoenbuchensis]|uniref:Phage related protein n=1 Tax=Bartonella schoenbuchensis (strain DSM 13525 / NCTC 13165 / R1) TaxID=687861 RepID=E6YZP3_BARSR|nr:DUF1376 domain-containing protein [Bartonella schoenbuchensis]AQX30799.1 putative hypothetical protein YdaU, DUF1376 family [Bartonella schoenbuchensis R1]CBI82331.1 conserved hypothetical protein [Bartonella schoenbuchensis R1]
MATKLPWVRNFYEEWIMDFSGTSAAEKATYMTLTALMYRAQEPIWEEITTLARRIGCSVNALNKTLDLLLRKGKIIRLEDGRLWSQQVEEELKDCKEKSAAASKAVNARWKKAKESNHDHCLKEVNRNVNETEAHYDRNTELIQNRYGINTNEIPYNNNIYNKKTNTIVLSKKENALEDLATEVSVQSETTDEMVEKHLDHDTPSSENQSPVSQQKSTEKKTKRSGDKRGCRIPEDFEPDYDFAIQEGLPPERVKIEIAKFRDYWKGKSGQGATKTDWPATWRNWVRKAVEDLKKGKNYGKPGIEQTKQQRGWNYRVAQHMSNIKTSDNVFKFLFEDDERTAVPLENGAKTIDCRSEESYLIGP